MFLTRIGQSVSQKLFHHHRNVVMLSSRLLFFLIWCKTKPSASLGRNLHVAIFRIELISSSIWNRSVAFMGPLGTIEANKMFSFEGICIQFSFHQNVSQFQSDQLETTDVSGDNKFQKFCPFMREIWRNKFVWKVYGNERKIFCSFFFANWKIDINV